jgi:hypothetical protein
MGSAGVPVPCAAEVSATAYWTHTLSPWVLALTGELALLQPSDPVALARAVCSCAPSWTGECRSAAGGELDADSPALQAYMEAVGQPLVEALTAGILAAGDPLPANPGSAGLPCLGAEGAIARAAAEGLAALGPPAAPAAVRTHALKSATAFLREGLAAAAREGSEHGGLGVELEPSVPRATLEAYIASRQGGGAQCRGVAGGRGGRGKHLSASLV